MKYLLLFIACSIVVSSSVIAEETQPSFITNSRTVKNCIVLIPDGCGIAHTTISRWCKGAPLAQDALYSGMVQTYSANSAITGSAAAATAFATGFKTWEDNFRAHCIALRPDSQVLPLRKRFAASESWRPVATLLEAAHLSGRSTGLVATAPICHATPAAYSSHWHERDHFNVLVKQQVHQNIDVVLAGGLCYLLPTAVGGTRNDGENLRDSLIAHGYTFITSRQQLDDLPTTVSKVWGAFNCSALYTDLDRKFYDVPEPSLAECTRKAISVLSQNDQGFFLMVEGSLVDIGSHANDPVKVVCEFLAFDSAVAVALDFARTDESTEVLIFADHDNGGMSLGARGDDYTSIHPDHVTAPIKNCKLTCTGFLDSLIRYKNAHGPIDWTVVGEHLESLMGIDTLYPEDTLLTIPASANNASINNEDIAKIGAIISRRSSIGWTTNGHTGNDVPIYSLLTPGFGTIDNTDIARYCEHLLELDLQKASDTLYAAIDELFSANEATVSLDTAGVIEGKGSVTIELPNHTVFIPFFRNYFTTANGKMIMLPGITVYSQLSNRVFVPRAAKELITGIRHLPEIHFGFPETVLSDRYPATIAIYNIAGREVGSFTVDNGTLGSIDCRAAAPQLPQGCYLIRVQARDKSYVKRVSVMR